jgi:hypothetical protein
MFDHIGLIVEVANGCSINGSDIVNAGSSVKSKLFCVVELLV